MYLKKPLREKIPLNRVGLQHSYCLLNYMQTGIILASHHGDIRFKCMMTFNVLSFIHLINPDEIG